MNLQDHDLNQALRFKGVNDAGYRIDHLSEEREDRQVVAQPVGFREHYERGCPLHVHFGWWLWERPTEVHHRGARFDWLFTNFEALTLIAPLNGSHDRDYGIHDKDGAVFIDVVQFADDPQVVSSGPSGVSLEWLRLADRCDLRTRVGKDAFETLEGATLGELRGRIKDGELNPSQEVGVFTEWLRHRVHDVVQTRTQLVDGVTKDDSVLNRWFNQLGAVYQVPVLVHMNVERCGAFYRATTKAECGFEVVEVLVRPFHWITTRLNTTGRVPIVQLNHPSSMTQDYGVLNFGTLEATLTTVRPFVRTIQIINGPHSAQSSGNRVNTIKSRSYMQYLNAGFRIAPTADQDNHFITHGSATDHRTVVLAPALTKRDILDGIRQRRVYASQDRNLRVQYTIDGHPLGSVIGVAANTPIRIEVQLADPDEPNATYRVSLRRDQVGGELEADHEFAGSDRTGDGVVFDQFQHNRRSGHQPPAGKRLHTGCPH